MGLASLGGFASGKNTLLSLFLRKPFQKQTLKHFNNIVFSVVAERSLGKQMQDCGGSRTELGYNNNTCDDR